MIIFLLGYMGSGKTRVAKGLAKKLGFEYLDTDQAIEHNQGLSVTDIFELNGEDEFRKLEHKILRSVKNGQKLVVATGGGTPCYFDNMEWMKSAGLTIYLKVPEGMLIQRLLKDRGERPLLKHLNDDDLRSKIKQQLFEREEYYNQAELIFEGADLDMNELIQQVSDIIFK